RNSKRIRKKLRSKRIENIKQAEFINRAVPEEFYMRFKPFFTEKQLKALYKTAMNSLKFFDLDEEEKLEAVIYGMECLVKALKRYHNGKGEPIYNIYAYINRTVLHIGGKSDLEGDIYAYTDAAAFRKLTSS